MKLAENSSLTSSNVRSTCGFLAAVFVLVLPCAELSAHEDFPGRREDSQGIAKFTFPIEGDDIVQVLAPRTPKAGRPWVLASQLYDPHASPVSNMSRTELALVERGFHIVAMPLGSTFGAPDAIKKWDTLYRLMIDRYGLCKEVALLGCSREGLDIGRWAAANPGKATCLYLDKAVCDFKSWPGGKLGVGKGSTAHWKILIESYGFQSEAEALAYPWNPIDLAPKLVAAQVAILYLAGETDEVVPFSENGERLEKEYRRLGGTFKLIMHAGEGHHPHGAPDPKPIVDFIEQHTPIHVEKGPVGNSQWRPVPGHIMTPWADQVNPNDPLPEYPRPQMVRKDWVNLNGLWDYAIQPMDAPRPIAFDGRILVPFPVESALSGVRKPLWKDERLWYRRIFETPYLTNGKRLLLHFGAVDWEANVFINGEFIGKHRGGYDAFSFDITENVKVGEANELMVAVFDATGQGQPAGKQNFNKFIKPGGIAYAACSGIWQTVWLESVSDDHISQLSIVPDVDGGCVRVTVAAAGRDAGTRPTSQVEIEVLNGDQVVARSTGAAAVEHQIAIANPQLWSPNDPFLYDLRVRYGDDEVTSYFGMRKIALGKDSNGFTSLVLNDKPLFQAGPLDQGYWPDGLYTAPTDEALRWDISEMKRLGFNMVRKHIKVESARWFYWCDKLGLLVWQDMPNGGGGQGGNREHEGVMGSPEVAQQFEVELHEMIDQFRNHPSIIMWVIFNEAWGQYDTARLAKQVKSFDPSRIVNSASGWADIGCGDVHDRHNYPTPVCPEPEPSRASVLGEFGGVGLWISGHTWAGPTWGYRSVTGERSLTRRYLALWREVWKLRETRGLCAAVYTQWTDIETEGNGLYTYDRKLLKANAKEIADAHRGEFAKPVVFEDVVPTSLEKPVSWRYTNHTPKENWFTSSFDDSSWQVGKAGFGATDFSEAPVRTVWESDEIWLRREFVLNEENLHFPALRVFHSQEIEIYLNGILAVRSLGRTHTFEELDISFEAAQTLRSGVNHISVYCSRGKRIPYIDVGLVQEVSREEE